MTKEKERRGKEKWKRAKNLASIVHSYFPFVWIKDAKVDPRYSKRIQKAIAGIPVVVYYVDTHDSFQEAIKNLVEGEMSIRCPSN